jgi:hypothetical protein
MMGERHKFVFTKPIQMPLFEEKDDGSLQQYSKE